MNIVTYLSSEYSLLPYFIYDEKVLFGLYVTFCKKLLTLTWFSVREVARDAFKSTSCVRQGRRR